MKYFNLIILTIIISISFNACNNTKETKDKNGVIENEQNHLLISFYNVENLFDTIDNPNTIDEQFLPDSKKEWNSQKYTDKLNKLSTVLSSYDSIEMPELFGLCEIENKMVIQDLINQDALKSKDYKIVHFESPDKRGIDNAIVYDAGMLNLIQSKTFEIDSFENNRLFTRDIVMAEMEYNGNSIYFFVNHWPSRRGGQQKSEPRRIAAAEVLKSAVDSIKLQNPMANIVIMGDFNDEPDNISISQILNANELSDSNFENNKLYNLSYSNFKNGVGTYHYWKNNEWNMLDQIIVSGNLLSGENYFSIEKDAYRINKKDEFLFNGVPSKTYGKNYYGGYSDHLSPFIFIEINKKRNFNN